ncbi:MAG: hypothetical protein A3E87_06975 [Gammaproteobacteria bacterium RIFCSPHIGHO2_12_FULL_35_23]|nr:MAG: hypothetical protein A3E87_06975 [Gammaproteobacteria bacterium RIFCSPHIGHO2_12_FULL_35_23]
MKIIAFMGYRQPAIRTAKQLGFSIIVWSNKPIPFSVRESLVAYYISEFPTSEEKLSSAVINFFQAFNVDCFIALTEAGVIATALLKQVFHHPVNIEKIKACHDKFLMKTLAKNYHIPITDFQLLTKDLNTQEIFIKWGTPVYAKPRASSGSRNLYITNHQVELEPLINKNFLIEQAIKGIEMSVEFFICSQQIIFLNLTEYYKTLEINIIPGPNHLVNQTELTNLITRMMKAFELNNTIVHMEFFKTPLGLVIGELAIRPPGGYLMEAIEKAYGFNPWQTLIEINLNQTPFIKTTATHYVAVWVFHPGAGKITAIEGLAELKKLPSFESIHLKKKVGDLIKTRKGTGEDVAKLLFVNNSYQALIHDLEIAKAHFKITQINNF